MNNNICADCIHVKVCGLCDSVMQDACGDFYECDGDWIKADVLREIKKEIELKEKTLTDKYGQTKYGVWTDDICNVFDKYIEKYSNT